jgi:hypothetical protein
VISPRILFLSTILSISILLIPAIIASQNLRVENSTTEFTDYVLTNDSLKIAYRFELTVPYNPGTQTWRLLDQEIVRRTITNEEIGKLSNIIDDVEPGVPAIYTQNPGTYRKQQVASLLLHVARFSENSTDEAQITRFMRVRVYNAPNWETTAQRSAPPAFLETSSPLSNGVWYKIPVTRDGIHQLDRSYLQTLGVNVASIDPRNIQLWGTDGYELPHLNSAARPEFAQIPIIVTGESDGRLDAADIVLFYGNSPNRYVFDASNNQFSHRIHPYSKTNYVFLTVGNEPGIRLNETQIQTSPSRTISTFRDFIWKEEELRRPDNRTKSGYQWLGQQFSTESFARTQPIITDTIPGFVQGSTVDVVVEFAARATSVSRFDVRYGNSVIGSSTITSVGDLNRSDGRAANTSRLSRSIQNVNLSNGIFELIATFENSNSGTFGWLDWIRVWVTRELRPKNNVLHYFSPNDGSNTEIADFALKGFSNRPIVMDVTNPAVPVLYATTQNGNDFVVRHSTTPGKRFVAQTQFFRPEQGRQIPNQNLKGISDFPDYIIVTNETLYDEALVFADYRRNNGDWNPIVVRQGDIFNEFSGGVMDVAAIRDYVRFLYLRAGQNPDRIPKHLLMFGDATYDYKGILSDARLQNHVITYQSEESLDRAVSYGSDDFFVLLDENEGLWPQPSAINPSPERIDMGVGRLPVQTPQEAQLILGKIRNYEDPSTFGDWRTLLTFTSDDDINSGRAEGDLHVWNADGTAESIDRDQAGVRINKIYQVNYPIVNSPLGRLAPEANQAFVNSINNGTLAINYSGHGSEQLLSAEQLFRSEDIVRLNNVNKPTIFVTATCDFGRFDDTDEQSGAEKLILWRNGGAIAAYTTTRVVYTSSSPTAFNFGLNIQLTNQMVRRDSQGLPSTLGDIYLKTKNTTVGASFNSRKFILLGDPAMRIGLPRNQVELTSINDIDLTESNQTINLRALDQAVVSGFVANADGSVNTSFNGEANVQVYDADRFVALRPLANGCSFIPNNCSIRQQNDLIFNGQVTVANGIFSSRFIIPNDIAYSDQNGRVLVYSQDPSDADAVGSFSNIVFNGRNPDAVNDNTGPDIQIYLNDTDFVDGGLVSSSPRLIVDLVDQSGINTAGAGIGHELMAFISKRPSENEEQTIILNSFYRSELDDFTKGRVEYPLDQLEEGNYTIRIRAWDVFNNVSEKETTFLVANPTELAIKNVYNYPNPMNSYTRFVFEHNQAGQEMDVQLRIYTLSGKPVARISRENLITSGNLVQIAWDGHDDDNNPLAAGTYLYHLQVKSDYNGKKRTEEKIERIVIIR